MCEAVVNKRHCGNMREDSTSRYCSAHNRMLDIQHIIECGKCTSKIFDGNGCVCDTSSTTVNTDTDTAEMSVISSSTNHPLLRPRNAVRKKRSKLSKFQKMRREFMRNRLK